jgi:hypothetical protein
MLQGHGQTRHRGAQGAVMSARIFVQLAHLLERRPQPACASLDEARLAAFPFNAARSRLGLPLLTHAVIYLNGRRVAVRPLDPAEGA